MKHKNTIKKNIYAVIFSIEYENGEKYYDILDDYFDTKKGALREINSLKARTPITNIKKYFGYNIIKYSCCGGRL